LRIRNTPYFQLITIQNRDSAILSEKYYQNPFAKEEKGKGIKISEWLLGKGVTPFSHNKMADN